MKKPESDLRVGFGRTDITPPLGTPLFGYALARPADAIADRLSATVLVLSSGLLEAVLVSLDLCAIDESEVGNIRAAIAADTGISERNVTVCATHTHSGPGTVQVWGFGEKNQAYADGLPALVAGAVRSARNSMRPVRVGVATTRTQVGVNRREVGRDGKVILGYNPWGPYDDTATVIRFEGASGPVTQIVHLSAHPTARGTDATISRDWPGVMVDRLEAVTRTPVLFINGAFGDVAPRLAMRTSAGFGEKEVMEAGLRAAHDALEAWHGIKAFDGATVETLHGELPLPYAPLPPLDEAAQQVEILQPHANDLGERGWLWNYWSAVCQAHREPPADECRFRQTITRIGPVAIVPFAGEIFSEIALRLKSASPFAHTLCAGTANGCHGYYVTREARGRGGYEVLSGRAFGVRLFSDAIDDVLVSENLALLSKLNRRSHE